MKHDDERDHTVKIDADVWTDLLKLTDTPHKYVRKVILKHVTLALSGENGNGGNHDEKPKVKAPHVVIVSPPPPHQAIDVNNLYALITDTSNQHGPWPLTPEVEGFMRKRGLHPSLLKPDHSRDDDEEYQVCEIKKFWIRDGYRCEGMKDPNSSLFHLMGDIKGGRPWSEFGENVRSAFNAMCGKYVQWKKRQMALAA